MRTVLARRPSPPDAPRRGATGALLAVGLALGVALAQGPVAVSVAFFIVEPDGRLIQADSALPGQMVEYQLVATNTGATTLPADSVVITGPVPEGTVFVPGSATPTSARVLTEYSLDGETFAEAPAAGEPGGEAEDARRYRAVRWTLRAPFAPDARAAMSYRVVVGVAPAP